MSRYARLVPVVVAVLVAVVGVVGAVGPARAAGAYYCTGTCLKHDARGDAAARADLLSARLSNGQGHFYATIRLRNLGRTGSFVFGAGLAGYGQNYWVTRTATTTTVKVQVISEVSVYPKEPCSRARVTWDAANDVIHAAFPYECTGSNPARAESIINGIDFHAGGATDHMGRVFYRP